MRISTLTTVALLLDVVLTGCQSFGPGSLGPVPGRPEMLRSETKRLKSMSIGAVDQMVRRHLASDDSDEAHLLFHELVSDGRPALLPLGWKLAATKPTAGMKEVVSHRLAMVMAIEGHRRPVLPEVVDAIVANELTDAYPLLRNSFSVTGKLSYLRGMMKLGPTQATEDIMALLGSGGWMPRDEPKRQTREFVRTALQHLKSFPPPLINPHYHRLFHLATTEVDGEIRKLAVEVLAPALVAQRETLAFLLSRTDSTIQLRLIAQLNADNAVREQLALFLEHLRRISPDPVVKSELAKLLANTRSY